MGFLIMILSILLGVFLVIFGIAHRNRSHWHKISIALGIVLVLFAIYLGLPK